jgi:hypothetical protein
LPTRVPRTKPAQKPTDIHNHFTVRLPSLDSSQPSIGSEDVVADLLVHDVLRGHGC